MALPSPSFDRTSEIEKTTRFCQRKDLDYNKYINYVDSLNNAPVGDRKRSMFSILKKDKAQAPPVKPESSRAAYDQFVSYYRAKLLSMHKKRVKLYQAMYDFWGQHLGPELLPARKFDIDELTNSPGFDELFGSIPPTTNSNFVTESVIAHLVFAGCKTTIPSLAANRKLAKLDTGTLVFVPPSAQIGDSIFFFEHTLNSVFEFHEIPFVLRPYKLGEHSELDASILSAEGGVLDQQSFSRFSLSKLDSESAINKEVTFTENARTINHSPSNTAPDSEDGRESPLLREGRNHRRHVKHFTFVGEAFVDGQMLGKGRSRRYHTSKIDDAIVFALH